MKRLLSVAMVCGFIPFVWAQPVEPIRVLMDAGQQTPVNNSRALGTGYATWQADGSLAFKIAHTVHRATTATLHVGPRWEKRAAIFTFESATNPLTGSWMPSESERLALESGELYLNIASEAYPEGEIRGQVIHTPRDNRRYVTITNLTEGQIFSPPVVLAHNPNYRMFEMGTQAPPYLSPLAEDGQGGALVAAADLDDDVLVCAVASAPLGPGESVTLPIQVSDDFDRITVTGMLVTTNDGFFAIRGMETPNTFTNGLESRIPFTNQTNQQTTARAYAYDAGTEANSEDCTNIPGPPCNSLVNRELQGVEGRVYLHPGIAGKGDLDASIYGWNGAVAEIRVNTLPPDLETITMDLNLDTAIPGAYVIQEPGMCQAGSGTLTFTHSKVANVVVAELDLQGLPYQFSTTRPDSLDMLPFSAESTPYNNYPAQVENGVWQMWISGFFNNANGNFWYGPDGILLGSEFNVEPSDLPIGSVSIALPVLHCIGTPQFESTPDGRVNARFMFKYDNMLDRRGSAGFFFANLPYDLGTPAERGIYFTEGGLPAEAAFSFDDCMALMDTNTGWFVSTTLETFPKPDYMLSRPSRMPGFKGTLPPTPLSDLWMEEGCETRVIQQPQP